jgi:hypothetical protein
VEAELLTIADRMASIQQRFVQSRSEMFLKAEDQAEFKGLAVEAKAILDGALGRANDFSMNLIHAVNSGSGGFFGGPSYACVGEAVVLVRSAANHIRRQPLSRASALSSAALKPPYVDPSRLAAIRGALTRNWDLSRLAQLCGELNVAHEHECFMSVAMLVRAIVDHVPPVFGCTSFAEVANNYAGAYSFKKSMQNLNSSLRNIADAHLHVQIRRSESIPTAVQVNFSADLDVLLAEVLRLVA